MSDKTDRRRYQRIKPIRPLPGRFEEQKVFIVDVSIDGAKIAHQARFGKQESTLKFEWNGQQIAFRARITRTDIEKYSKEPGKTLYHSGVELLEPMGMADKALRELIAGHIVRVLDERRANAKGIPPETVTFRQTAAKQSGFIQCRFTSAGWQKTKVPTNEQPKDGFTISAEEPVEQVDLLCKSYEEADASGREMIRKLAEISVSQEGGFATRHYEP